VELLVARCAGLDVAKDEVVACVRVPDGHGGRAQQVRRFQTFTLGLEALAGWLAGEGVTRVVLEATGQQLETHLVAAGGGRLGAAVGQRPPRPGSSPVARPTWPMPPGWPGLLEHGLLRASFVPPPAIRELRDPGPLPQAAGSRPIARRASATQKSLEDAGSKLKLGRRQRCWACRGGRC
jgi:transposase